MATACIGTTNSPSSFPRKNSYEGQLITALTDNSAIIALLFGNQPSIEWEQFKADAVYHLRAKESDLDNLQGVLGCELGVLDKAHFSKFLRWFSPLVPESDSVSSRAPSSVWKISAIATLVRQPWFHGFSLDTSRRLKKSTEGTFLVRFGCQAPHFVLALKDKSTESVMEWRVLATSGSVRLQDGERFQDLHKLVHNYTTAVPYGASCPLVHSCI
eukprot:Phypoly_transcript_14943.p1 GENE.Phypoly_transcript_14943~~Phypoly_transcript_14943.p1  ORF type:complete len:250 (+),score=10.78 Phypoly_transcript_14943:108-752(+)